MVSAPELKTYLNKRLCVQLNGTRTVTGTLRGYDVFMNVTLSNAVEEGQDEKINIGTIVIRGNSIVSMEALEKV